MTGAHHLRRSRRDRTLRREHRVKREGKTK